MLCSNGNFVLFDSLSEEFLIENFLHVYPTWIISLFLLVNEICVMGNNTKKFSNYLFRYINVKYRF